MPPPSVPATPAAPTITPHDPINVRVAPAPPNSVTGAEYQIREVGQTSWTPASMHTGLDGYTLARGLHPATSYDLRARFRNSVGWSEWSPPGRGSTTDEWYYFAQRDPAQYPQVPLVHPHPLPHSRLRHTHPQGVYGSTWKAVYSVRSRIALAQGESFPAPFKHYIRRPQTTGSTPRRTYLGLADWMPVDHKTGAKAAADVKIGHREHQHLEVLYDEAGSHLPGARSSEFHLRRAEIRHALAARDAVHASIDAEADGKPIADSEINAFVATARRTTAPVISTITKSGARGRTIATITGTGSDGASVRVRFRNVTRGHEREAPWSAWQQVASDTRAYRFANLPVGRLAFELGDKIAIDVEQWPGGQRASTTAATHVTIL